MPRGFWHPKLKKQRTPIEERFWPKVSKCDGDGCWLWLGTKNVQGYGSISRPGGKKQNEEAGISYMARAHRVAWEITYGPIGDGLDVLHRCDNPSCVRPDHLFLGTDKDNVRDAKAKGRLRPGRPKSGEAHHNAKLTGVDVANIKTAVSGGESQKSVSRRYCVHQSHVSKICSGKVWSQFARAGG